MSINNTKNSDFLVCIDSDGCAMDTMNYKHQLCFGPEFVKVYGLEEHKEEALKVWNRVNLFSLTRGINRFLALVQVLEILKDQGIKVMYFSELQQWVKESETLSNSSLMKQFERTKNLQFQLAYTWSMNVNEEIEKHKNMAKPFEYVKEVLKEVSKSADIAVVSSANRSAVLEEWGEFGLLEYVNTIFTQEDGTKRMCIQQMLDRGYDKEHTVMIGDAPGDLKAAMDNGVKFYPILVNQEAKSWCSCFEQTISLMKEKKFTQTIQQQLIRSFHDNLNNG